ARAPPDGARGELRDAARRRELRVEPADGEGERRITLPAQAHRHVAGDREPGDRVLVEHGLDGDLATRLVEHPDGVHAQLDERATLLREGGAELAEDDDAP